MPLRLILLVLALLAFFSATTGGYLYYDALREAAFDTAERQAVTRLEMIKRNLSAYLSENIKPTQTLAGMAPLARALEHPREPLLAAANAMLDHFKKTLDVDVCYLMDPSGLTIASSNRDAPDSFVGKNFAFRPYFKKAIAGSAATYLALGTASNKRGAYYSHPIYTSPHEQPAGIVVIKASIELIEKELGPAFDEIVLVTDPRGVVFISNQPRWRYHLLWQLPADEVDRIRRSRQFGQGPWQWTGLRLQPDLAVAADGARFLIHRTGLERYPGWHIIHLHSQEAIARSVARPFIRIAGPIVLTLCVLMGLAVSFLYRKASHEIARRRSVEAALRQSEERYRSIYHNTPAMLHSVDPQGRLVSVSDHWLEALGYRREEVVGKRLTDFFTPQSRRLAEEQIFPAFFRTGFCKDVPYQFVKKDGATMDILLSAIGDRDPQGGITRSLAVSIDVTERNRAEAALKQAKEALSLYSRDLERQVRKRTREISSILAYTPAVVYIKDRQGRYLLVNTRYEQLFGVKAENVRGKTDYAILPARVADQFRANDRKVLRENRSDQFEEVITQKEGRRIYLSVKFPVYDEAGTANGVCSISTDITAVKKAQEKLRRLSGSIMASQEKERAAIARELHDELGQVLTALRMDSVWLMERLKASDDEATRRVLAMCRLIDTTIEEVRGMAFRLRPGVLDDLGLVDALEVFTSDFERRTGIPCVFEHPDCLGPGAADDGVATAAYRITQEALTNVARHSAAGHVDVILRSANGRLSLSVSDDGRGFSVTELSETETLGVAVMRERASLVGGRLQIDSRPGRGTRVTFEGPLSSGMHRHDQSSAGG